jgi:hypothetical protein
MSSFTLAAPSHSSTLAEKIATCHLYGARRAQVAVMSVVPTRTLVRACRCHNFDAMIWSALYTLHKFSYATPQAQVLGQKGRLKSATTSSTSSMRPRLALDCYDHGGSHSELLKIHHLVPTELSCILGRCVRHFVLYVFLPPGHVNMSPAWRFARLQSP